MYCTNSAHSTQNTHSTNKKLTALTSPHCLTHLIKASTTSLSFQRQESSSSSDEDFIKATRSLQLSDRRPPLRRQEGFLEARDRPFLRSLEGSGKTLASNALNNAQFYNGDRWRLFVEDRIPKAGIKWGLQKL